ncbi:MAG: tRNA threonylcarbamoyladenosine dehydratase [Clostridia bacterium]|nr:tRNA threonylcarbamoyladenosine dehydratase [Clostridia bacterium]
MNERFQRSSILLGEAAMEKLQNARVLLFGIGGVGGTLAEALARSGVGSITLVDNDTVSVSNINRQIIATDETVGMAKTEAMKKRIHAINPNCNVTVHNLFYLPDTEEIITKDYDYIADAIDTVTAKIDIIVKAKALGVPVISSMGTGNKLHPELLEIENLHNTSVCPLCRVMRTELKKRGITDVTVVYSKETPRKPLEKGEENNPGKRQTPGSVSFVPPAAGLLMASRIVQDITNEK